MNILRSSVSRLCGVIRMQSPPATAPAPLRLFSSCLLSRHPRAGPSHSGPLMSHAEGAAALFPQPPWQIQQLRTAKRGTEYQPKNIKRKRTHGWIKRCSSRGGIEVLLRRMLKRRKSLSH
ncbi:unnamed protein product [Knipowitschia caucasica]|uniref:Large ribosomal subunit protein bL34m n=1 Tax=Knipowitschia caucasica TaxID=637954 RepID=A0AAV2JP12_KNICA